MRVLHNVRVLPFGGTPPGTCWVAARALVVAVVAELVACIVGSFDMSGREASVTVLVLEQVEAAVDTPQAAGVEVVEAARIEVWWRIGGFAW